MSFGLDNFGPLLGASANVELEWAIVSESSFSAKDGNYTFDKVTLASINWLLRQALKNGREIELRIARYNPDPNAKPDIIASGRGLPVAETVHAFLIRGDPPPAPDRALPVEQLEGGESPSPTTKCHSAPESQLGVQVATPELVKDETKRRSASLSPSPRAGDKRKQSGAPPLLEAPVRQSPRLQAKQAASPQSDEPKHRHVERSERSGHYRTGPYQAVSTEFDGITFRSRLEARTACLMRELGIRYNYEDTCFKLPNGGTYTPDFYLPEQNLYLEIKPCYPHIEELQRCEAVAAMGHPIVLLYGEVGPPHGSENEPGREHRSYDHSNNARGIAWDNKGNSLSHQLGWVWLWNPVEKRHELGPLKDASDWRWSTEPLRRAYDKAQSL